MPTPMTTGPEPAPAPQGFAPMPPDPYTTEARLCDDSGLVSNEPVPAGNPGTELDPSLTYRKLLNNLRAHTGLKPYDGAPVVCTGSAHLAREHIRCTSPAHLVTPPPPVRTFTDAEIRTAVELALAEHAPAGKRYADDDAVLAKVCKCGIETTPAEELRAAAQLLRERARAASGGAIIAADEDHGWYDLVRPAIAEHLSPWLMQAAGMYELGPRDLTEGQRSLWVSPADRAALALARAILATPTPSPAGSNPGCEG